MKLSSDEMREVFNALDTNNDGTLSRSELSCGLRILGLSAAPAAVGQLWEELAGTATGGRR